MHIFNDFISLIFGRHCVCCGVSISKTERHACILCINQLSKISYGTSHQEALEKMFYGKANINAAMSHFHFIKGGVSQALIHHLKYFNRPQIGVSMGIEIGNILNTIEPFQDVDLIIPVPMTRKKRRKRGYNQSEMIAKGIAQSLNKPVENRILQRTKQKKSQTHLNKFTRWQNINESFLLQQQLPSEIKHILLIDDVITTGATLESCANAIHEKYNVKISVASLAFAPLQG